MRHMGSYPGVDACPGHYGNTSATFLNFSGPPGGPTETILYGEYCVQRPPLPLVYKEGKHPFVMVEVY